MLLVTLVHTNLAHQVISIRLLLPLDESNMSELALCPKNYIKTALSMMLL